MIYGKLNTPSTYTPLVGHPIWEQALGALGELTESSPLGITELRGRNMFINVHTYNTLPLSGCRFEGHRNTIDVQYIISGGELVDWVLKEELQADGPYQIEKDFQYYLAPQSFMTADTENLAEAVQKPNPSTRVHLKAGYFGVFFPEDGHRPKLNDGIHKQVYKAVVKINRALLD
jgi:biofilm protein TabA